MKTLSSPSLSKTLVVQVMFPVPLPKGFDYLTPESYVSQIQVGQRVLCPFGKQRFQMGIVTNLYDENQSKFPLSALKSLIKIVDTSPVLNKKDFELAEWISKQYFCSLGEALFAVLPIKKQLPPKKNSPKSQQPLDLKEQSQKHSLTEEQKKACEILFPLIQEKTYKSALLWGVAASGKTEVYLNCIEKVLAQNRSAIYLVPEIGLTPQVESLLKNRFGDQVSVWHSEIPRGERWKIWERITSGECKILLGARSALFLPLKNLGLIVIDEEHDTSYKQDATPFYHARDVSLQKGKIHNALVLYGSATPSMETYQKALNNEVTLIKLSQRVLDRPPPQIHITDMKKESGWYISDPLIDAIQKRLQNKEQTLLFLNRRGFSTYTTCLRCGWEARCPHCGVSLIYHKLKYTKNEPALKPDQLPFSEGDLRCHYCFYKSPFIEKCPQCKEMAVKRKGRGTQKVFSDLQLLFPNARILRWDRDSTRKKDSHREAYHSVKSESVDIIVGTQMIAQGLDFPQVTLVGILDADRPLGFPDFRAGERTFQLLMQVSGRAGRADLPGEVYLQTRHPEHYAIQAAKNIDFSFFSAEELKFRFEMGYPPFQRLTIILVRSRKEESAEKAAEELMQWLEKIGLPENVSLLGPAPSFHKRRADIAQWQILIKSSRTQTHSVFELLRKYTPPKSVSLVIDVDPEDLQ